MIIVDIILVLAGVYVLYKICFPSDYTEVDDIMEEQEELRKKRDK